jgi:phage shock protein C
MARDRLARSRKDAILGGVCGGIADYLGWSSTGTRIVYVLVSLCSTGFPGTIVYIVLWLLLPLDDEDPLR